MSKIEDIFIHGRSHNDWTSKEVPENLLHELYDIMKWGPTSANCSPARIVFIKTNEAKEGLVTRLRNEGCSYRSIRSQTGLALSTIRRIILDSEVA